MAKKSITLTKEDILKLAQLSNLPITEDEIEKYRKQLNDMLEYVNQLAEVDTSSVQSTSHTTGLTNIMSDDEANDKRRFKKLEKLHTKEKNGKTYFIVDRIM